MNINSLIQGCINGAIKKNELLTITSLVVIRQILDLQKDHL